ncbi:MAG: GNAT family N-acetyltransferase [Actinomycetota bacterium]
MLIREARPDDWPDVAELLAQLGRPDVRTTGEEAAARQVFERYLDRADAVILVAEDGGKVVGLLDMEYRVRLNFTTPQAWIPDMVVEEDSRSAGMGRALMARAEELARERGCWGMELESATWRERAHAFYLREGWTDSGKSFSKLLAEGLTWPPTPPS